MAIVISSATRNLCKNNDKIPRYARNDRIAGERGKVNV